MSTKKKLGQILLEAGAIDEYQLKSALGYQKKWGGLLGHVLVENRFVTEEALVAAIQEQTGIAFVQLTGRIIPDYLIKLVPLDLAEKFGIIPIGLEGEAGKPSETLLIAMADPTNLNALDELRFKTGKRVRPVLAGAKAIADAIAVHYRGKQPGGLDFDIDPEGIQFGGQQVAADELKDDLVVVTGTLESGPERSASAGTAPAQPAPSAADGFDLDDPFSDLDSLAKPVTPLPIAKPSPQSGQLDDPFADLDNLAPGGSPEPTALSGHPAATNLDFDLDADDTPSGPGLEEAEVLDDLEIIEELEPLDAESPTPAESPPAPVERDLSMFGDAMDALPGDLDDPDAFGETISSLDSMSPPRDELQGLEQAADLSAVPDLDPVESQAPDQLQMVMGESLQADGGASLAEEAGLGFDFADGDDLDLDSVLAPISAPEGEPPGAPVGAPAVLEPRVVEEPPAVATLSVKPAQSDAMRALLSRVGLSTKKTAPDRPPVSVPAPAEVLAQPQPEAHPEPESHPEASSTGSLDVAAWSDDPVVAALVRLLVRKGLFDEDELRAELERE